MGPKSVAWETQQKKTWQDSRKPHGGFLKWGVPLVIIHFSRVFPYKPSSYWGIPILGKPQMGKKKQSWPKNPEQFWSSATNTWILPTKTISGPEKWDDVSKYSQPQRGTKGLAYDIPNKSDIQDTNMANLGDLATKLLLIVFLRDICTHMIIYVYYTMHLSIYLSVYLSIYYYPSI